MQDKLTQAKEHHLAGRAEEAFALYREVMAADPANLEAMFYCALLLRQAGQVEPARDMLLQATAINPNQPILLAALGEVQREMGDLSEAVATLRKALKLNPADAVSQVNLAICHQQTGNLVKAERLYRAAIKDNPSFAPALTGLGNLLLQLAQQESAPEIIAEASALLEQAVTLAPEDPVTLAALGAARHFDGKLEEAIDLCRKALSANPQHYMALNTMGSALMNLDRIDEALAAFSRARDSQPGVGMAQFNIGSAYYRQFRFDEATAAFEESARLMPGNPAAQLELGNIYLSTGQYEKAKGAYRAALDLDDGLAIAHRGLGLALIRLGEKKQAEEALRRVLDMDGGNAEARFALASLSGETPEAAPADYVAEKFDALAGTFDEELSRHLEYRTPELLRNAIAGLIGKNKPKWAVADIGCGTGLCGPLLREWAARLIGSDLSPGMIEKATERGIYDELRVEALERTLGQADGEYDLAVAADVFVYVGNLEPVFTACAAALKPGALFAFSTEETAEGDYEINAAMRYAHSQRYVSSVAEKSGFDVVHAATEDIRKEAGTPVKGGIYVLRLGARKSKLAAQ